MERNGDQREQQEEQQQEHQHEQREVDDEVRPAPQPQLRFPRRIPPNPYPTAANPYLWPELSHITCHVCGYNGHYNLDCPYGERQCYRCRQAGHIVRECRVREPRAQPAARQQENVEEEWWDAAPIQPIQQDEVQQQEQVVAEEEHEQEQPPEEEHEQEQPPEEEHEQQQEPEDQQEEQQHENIIPVDLQCLLCYERRRSMVYIPCGHMCVCTVCHYELEAHAQYDYDHGRTIMRCPLCRTLVVTSQQVFL